MADVIPAGFQRGRDARRIARTIELVTQLQGRPPNRNREHLAISLRISPGKTKPGAEDAVERQLDLSMPFAVKLAAETARLLKLAGDPPIEVYCDVDRTAAEPDAALTDEQAALFNLKRGTKAAKYDRAEYDAMMEAIADGRCKGFVCYRFDRFNRSPSELESLIALIVNRPDIAIAAAHGGHFDLTDAHGRATARMLSTMAALEIDLIKSRRKDQLLQAYRKGLCTTRKPPGYKYIDPVVTKGPDGKDRVCNIAPVDADAEVIRAGWEAIFGTERRSVAWVARRWNDHHWDTYSGQPWTVETVMNTLCSASQAAVIEAEGSKILMKDLPGAWQPILTWEQVQRARRQRKERKLTAGQLEKHGGGRKHASLLTGFLQCSVCGSTRFARQHHSRSGCWRYACNSARQDQPELPEGVKRNHLSRKCEVVDEFVVRKFLDWVHAMREEILGASSVLHERIRAQEVIRDDAQREIDELGRQRDAGEIKSSVYSRSVQPEEDKRDAAILELDRLTTSSLSPLRPLVQAADPLAAWNEVEDLEIQRDMLALAIERVVIKPADWSAPRPADVPPGRKWCTGCGQIRDLDSFHYNVAAKDKRVSRCKDCVSTSMAARYQAKKAGREFPRAGRLPAMADTTISIVWKTQGADGGPAASDAAGHAHRGAA
jgi:hypothetical protein